MKILIAEDEKQTAKALKMMLERNHYAADIVHNGSDALQQLETGNYDMAVMDIMMPGMDGYEVVSALRRENLQMPVLFLSAKSETEDKIRGLDCGGDDYLTKPFSSGEFIARIKALSRRAGNYTPDIITINQTVLDRSRFTVSCGSQTEALNNKEFQILDFLMRNPHIVFSAERIFDRIWGFDSEANIDVIWAYIAYIRRKLEKINADIYICTVRGAGYCLEDRNGKRTGS